MSTKTTFKRIALVAVAALGFGVLTSVAPASAAESPGLTTAINGVALTGNTNAINTSVSLAVGMTTAASAVNTTDPAITLSAKVTSFPVGGAANITSAFAVAAATDGAAHLAGTMTYTNVAPFASCIQTGVTNAQTLAATTTATAAGAGFCKLSFTPTVVGTYVVTVWRDYANVGTINDNEVSNTFSFTIGSASSAAATEIPNSADTTAGANTSINGVKVSSVGIVQTQVSGRTGIQVGFQPTYNLTRNAGTITGTNEVPTMVGRFATVAYTVTNPAGTAVTVVSAQGGVTASASQAIAGIATPLLTSATDDIARTQVPSLTTGALQAGSEVWFSAATAGVYTITAYHDANRDGLVGVGEATTTSTVTVAADALPSITFTTYGQSVPGDAVNNGIGHLVKITLKNGTAVASLGLSEVLTVVGPTGTFIDQVSTRSTTTGRLGMGDSSNGVSATLTQANFDAAGNAYINVGNSTAGGGTYTLTGTITGGTAAGAAGSGSFTVTDATTNPVTRSTANTDKSTTFTNLTGVAGPAARAVGASNATYALTVGRSTATTVTVGYLVGAANTTATSKTYEAELTDTYGLITGLIGGRYDMKRTLGTTATTATTAVTFSVAVPSLSSTFTGTAVSLVILQAAASEATSTGTYNISGVARAATLSYTNPALDAATYPVRTVVGSANSITAKVVDQFGIAMANIVVNAAIAGRNATTVLNPQVTNASGTVSFTYSDTSVSTTSFTDTVTISPSAGATSTVTYNYATYLAATTITMTTPDSATATATGIVGSVKTDISSADGPEAGAVSVSVVLKDVNGATLPSGVPVTFTVTGNTGAAILSTTKKVTTDDAGKASTSVYAYLNGNATVTATAGTVSASGIVYFVQSSTGDEARTITAKAEGNVVTAKVTDRFSNPIKGVTVTASRVGSGTFNGTSSLSGVTDAAGSVDFVLSNGTANVTVSLPTTGNYSLATKGFTDVGITALTAFTAGTIALAEAGVGASFDAAGVNSAMVSVSDTTTNDVAQAAADAAAEATDAANAATDAANAAAEAADAATAAAQDAADAVAALSTQVAEQINELKMQNDALRKQLVAITNLIIKIQKKVKA